MSEEMRLIISKEKSKVLDINIASDHQLIKKKWFDIKYILDEISKLIYPIGAAEKQIFLSPVRFDPNLFQEVLDELWQRKITSFYDYNKGSAVMTSKSAREYFLGNIIIKDRELFEKYRDEVSSLCDFIEKDGRSRFPEVYRGILNINGMINSVVAKDGIKSILWYRKPENVLSLIMIALAIIGIIIAL